jgi:hypothetical protein
MLKHLRNMDSEDWINAAVLVLILLAIFFCRFSCEVRVSTTAAI